MAHEEPPRHSCFQIGYLFELPPVVFALILVLLFAAISPIAHLNTYTHTHTNQQVND